MDTTLPPAPRVPLLASAREIAARPDLTQAQVHARVRLAWALEDLRSAAAGRDDDPLAQLARRVLNAAAAADQADHDAGQPAPPPVTDPFGYDRNGAFDALAGVVSDADPGL